MGRESSSAEIAFRFVEQLRTKCIVITATPLTGLPGRNFEGLRSFPDRDYVILYDARAEAVRMIRVLHARRDNDHLDFGQVA